MDTTIKYLTQEKKNELAKELDELKTKKRKEVAQNLEYARSLGDLSENAEYQEARELQANIESRIMVLENIMKNAEVVEDAKHGDIVAMAVTVHVTKDGGSSATFKIVGSEEANASQGKISNLSPLGVALMGKKKGDSVSISTPKGKVSYKITKIE